MRRLLFTSTLLVSTMISASAMAGFEWTPPTQVSRSVTTQMPEPQMAQQPLTNAGPLTPEPSIALRRTPIAIEPLDGAMLDEPPLPPQTRNNSTALPVPIDEPEMLLPPETIASNNSRVSSDPQVFVPETNAANRIEGFGRQIPLSIALKQIVPAQYVYKFNAGVTPKTKVSWQGGDTWVNVLNEMLDQADLSGTLNNNVIEISKGAGSLVTLPAPRTVLKPTSETALLGGETRGSIVDLQTRKTWSARSGMSLRDALQSWARQAGVRLEWQSNFNYPVGAVFNFEGTFDQAVDSLLSLYGDDQNPPKGKLYPNQPTGPSVLVIESL